MPMLLSCFGVCVLRIVWIMVAVPLKKDIYTIMFSYPLTWVVTTVLFVVYYLWFSKLRRFKRTYLGEAVPVSGDGNATNDRA